MNKDKKVLNDEELATVTGGDEYVTIPKVCYDDGIHGDRDWSNLNANECRQCPYHEICDNSEA